MAIEDDDAGTKVGSVMRVLDAHEVKELVLSHRARSYFNIRVSLKTASRMEGREDYQAQSVTLRALSSLRMLTKSDNFVLKGMMQIHGDDGGAAGDSAETENDVDEDGKMGEDDVEVEVDAIARR